MSGALDRWIDGSPAPYLGKGSDFSRWDSGAPVLRLGRASLVVFANDVLFRGEIVRASVRGRILTARCQSGGSIFDRQIPRFRVQTGCNHTLFDAGCRLAKADRKFTASIADPGTPGYPFEFGLAGLARATGSVPAFFAHWFAGGWAEFGDGDSWCRRPILRSTTVTAGTLTITLARDPARFPAPGDSVVLYPGCDGRWESCGPWHATNNPEGRFDNRLNFGGHPFVPAANPSLVKVSSAVAGGKKA